MNIRFIKTLALILLTTSASIAMADPSGRVGRVSYIQGNVDFRTTPDDDPFDAEINWPVTSQNVITVGRNGRAEFRVGSAAIRIDADSEVEITQLDDDHFDLRLLYGSAYVRIKNPELAHESSVFTPQGRIVFSEPSNVRIDTERAPDTTVLTVLDGTARLAAAGSSVTVREGKRAEIVDGDVRVSNLHSNDLRDDFDGWVAARAQRDNKSQSIRYVSVETTGYEDLDQYGSWQTTTEYGAVWYPRVVAADWAPYRVGRWTWVDPWGWTWVDSAPWGYAPFHYGRWVQYRNRWCWAPGQIIARPVWAPAMVGWIGGSNWSVSFSAGAAPAIGWFPLAPREVYVPSYRVSHNYLRQVNVTHVRNVTNVRIINGYASAPPREHYRNREVRNAVSVMPHDQFVSRRTVVVAAHPIRDNPRRSFERAPVSAVAPPSIVHQPGFGRVRDRNSAAPAQPRIAPGQQQRPDRPDHRGRDRDGAPPTVRLPAPRERGVDQPNRNPEWNHDRRPVQIAPPPVQQTPRANPPEFNRRPEPLQERRDPPNDVRNPVRDMPRFNPQPAPAPVPTPMPERRDPSNDVRNPVRDMPRFTPPAAPAQGVDVERGRRVQEIPRPIERREAQIAPPQPQAQPHPVPLKQAAPVPREAPQAQEERMRHSQQNQPSIRQERPAPVKEGNEGGGRERR